MEAAPHRRSAILAPLASAEVSSNSKHKAIHAWKACSSCQAEDVAAVQRAKPWPAFHPYNASNAREMQGKAAKRDLMQLA